MQEVLAEAGYVASNSEKYPLGGIISAIQNAFHTTPVLECSGDAVEDLYLCFYKNFEVRSYTYLLWMFYPYEYLFRWIDCSNFLHFSLSHSIHFLYPFAYHAETNVKLMPTLRTFCWSET